jgi:hypothetical protein
MVGVFVFPQKPSDGPYKDKPKNALSDEDADIIKNYHYASSYFIHWIDDDETDKMSDKEIVDYINTKHEYQIALSSRKSGKGYSTEDKKSYVRIIHQPYRVFSIIR